MTSLHAGLVATQAFAQPGYPSPTIRSTVAFIPGGTTDIIGRMVAEALERHHPRRQYPAGVRP